MIRIFVINVTVLIGMTAFVHPCYSQKIKPNIKRSEIIINYPDSTVKAMVFLKNIKCHIRNDRTYFWYYQDKINKNVGGYSGRILDGKYRVFDLDKNLVAEGSFKKGLKEGSWKRWLSIGGLISIENFRKGCRQGTSIYFDRTGQILLENKYKRGLKHGKCAICENDTIIYKMYRRDVEVIRELKSKDTKIEDKSVGKNRKEKPSNSEIKDDSKINKKDKVSKDASSGKKTWCIFKKKQEDNNSKNTKSNKKTIKEPN